MGGGMKAFVAVGIMSGTSLDGFDAVLCRAKPKGDSYDLKRIAHIHAPYPASWKGMARKIAAKNLLRESAFFGAIWSEEAAKWVKRLAKKSGTPLSKIDCIGIHGQTIAHLPSPSRFLGRSLGITVQLADISRLAVRTGITVVGNFRTADIAAGGEGAPLAPYAHRLLFAQRGKNVAIHNLGGIGNVTLLQGNRMALAFDTGPANIWIDTVVQWKTGGRLSFDRHGKLGRRGKPDSKLLSVLSRHPYFRRKPPKSAGWEEFGSSFLRNLWPQLRRLSIEDAVSTVTHATARATSDAYHKFVLSRVKLDRLVFCGGGARNHFLTELISQKLSPLSTFTSDRWNPSNNIPVDEVEAVAFALLALETIRGRPNNEPAATGAKRAVICGEIALASVRSPLRSS